MIPLTLRAMPGTRHLSARSSGPLFFLLPSVLALLALVCFPLTAGASEIPQYTEAPPEVPKTKKQTNGGVESEDETPARSSNTGEGGSTGGGSGSSGGSGGSGGSGDGSSAATNPHPSTEGSGGTGTTKDGKSATAGPKGGGTANKPVSSPAEADDSSSSPLVPILIAVAVLAAISIGAVLIKQRRQRDGADGAVSPKAS
jgi:hypothetical protein